MKFTDSYDALFRSLKLNAASLVLYPREMPRLAVEDFYTTVRTIEILQPVDDEVGVREFKDEVNSGQNPSTAIP